VTCALQVPERKPRVEPKTYFANERTFLQWLSISVLIIFIAFMMLEIDGAACLFRLSLPTWLHFKQNEPFLEKTLSWNSDF
jgi:uncharacterized membrane protein YidH (DUF202 family)